MTPPHAPLPDAGKLAGRLVVLLEDDALVRRATERVLRRFGAEVVSASCSADVLAALSGRDPGPICVVADYWLNRQEDGLTAAAAVCEAAGTPSAGLILTGDASDAIAATVAEAGFELLRKPVSVNSFLDALLRNS